MNLQFTPVVFLLLPSIMIAAGLGVSAWRNRRVPGAVPFCAVMAMVLVWTLANALAIMAVDAGTKLLWIRFQVISIVGTPVASLIMILQHTGRSRWITRRRVAMLCAVPAVTVAFALTDIFHGLLFRDLPSMGSPMVSASEFGPWFWAHVFYSFTVGFVNVPLLLQSLRHAPALYRGQYLALMVGVLTPVLGAVPELLGVEPLSEVRLSALLLAPGGAVIAWGLFRYRLFDIVPVARGQVIEGMGDGIVVIDARQRVVDINLAAQSILGCSFAKAAGQQAAVLFSFCPELIEICHRPAEGQVECLIGAGDGELDYEARVSLLTDDVKEEIGKVIVLHDISERKKVQAEKLQQQRALAALQERERVARDLHDSLGQVLAFINTQGQAVRESLASGQASVAESQLSRLIVVAQDAQAEVREYILGVRTSISSEQRLISALEHYLDRFGAIYGMKSELVMIGELAEGALGFAAEVQLLRIIQEALTNVRKHASSHYAKIEFAVLGGALQIAIEDDGQGFDSEQLLHSSRRTFGLHIMQERASEIGGTVEVSSTLGKGTRVIVRVPLQSNGHAGVDSRAPAGL